MERYGALLRDDIKIHRRYFNEMIKLLGVQVVFRAPRPDKRYTMYSEIDTNFYEPIMVGCIFDEHPNQRTLKKMGWISELQENASLISVPYDLNGLQVGAIFIVPSGLDNGKGRMFRVVSMYNSMIYPASITCEIVPEYEDSCEKPKLEYGRLVQPFNREEEEIECDFN